MPRNGKIPQQGCPSGRPEFALFGSNSLEIPQQGSLPGHTPQTRIPPKYPSRGACSGRLRTRIRRQRPLPGRIPPFEAEFPKYPSRGPFPGEFPDQNSPFSGRIPQNTPAEVPFQGSSQTRIATFSGRIRPPLPSRPSRGNTPAQPFPAESAEYPSRRPPPGRPGREIPQQQTLSGGLLPGRFGSDRRGSQAKCRRNAGVTKNLPGKKCDLPGNCLGSQANLPLSQAIAWDLPGKCLGPGKFAWEMPGNGRERGYFARIGALLPGKWTSLPGQGSQKGGKSPNPKKCYTYGDKKNLRPAIGREPAANPTADSHGQTGFLPPKRKRYDKRPRPCVGRGRMRPF